MAEQRKMHVLIIPSWYPKDANDFRGSFFREQALSLQKYQLQVGVISPEMKGFSSLLKGYQKPVLDSEIDCGIPTLRYFYANLIPKVDSLITRGWVKRGELLFNEYVKKYGKPDIIHAHSMFKAGFLAEVLSCKYDIPYVLTEHTTAFARGLIRPNQIYRSKKVVSSASALFAVSGEFKKLLNKTYSTNKWEYIPNIVNDEFFSKSEYSDSEHNQDIIFLVVCSLLEKKRVDVLIRGFYELQKHVDGIRLEIGGDGPELSRLKLLTKELKIDHLVLFLGKLSRDEVKSAMSRSDVFVLPSEYETFGVVVVEALALGKPVIATKCGGPESIIEEEVGLLVDVNSPEALSNAMKFMCENLENYDRKLVSNYCKSKFSEQAVIAKVVNRYKEILALHEKQ